MAKLAREKPLEHIVLPDTNILWHEDKEYAVSPEFELFWDLHLGSIPLTLIIPDVVYGELLFQQTTSATKALEKVTELLGNISSIIQAKHSHTITSAALRSQVENKLKRWLNDRSAVLASTPCSKISWERLIQDAIWRLPPFLQEAKNPKNEKGFRDALILETVADIAANGKDEQNVVFLSNDFLLRTTAAERLKSNKNFLAFESLNEFGAYIHLTKENLTNKFVKEIQVKARRKFWNPKDANVDPVAAGSIYYRNEISETIYEKFSELINTPVAPPPGPTSPFTLFQPQSWILQDQENWWIGPTQFVSLEDDRCFHWRSTVTLARLFLEQRNPSFGVAIGSIPSTPLQQRILLAPFQISWKSHVKSDGRFHDNEVVEITADAPTFNLATDEELKRWRLTESSA